MDHTPDELEALGALWRERKDRYVGDDAIDLMPAEYARHLVEERVDNAENLGEELDAWELLEDAGRALVLQLDCLPSDISEGYGNGVYIVNERKERRGPGPSECQRTAGLIRERLTPDATAELVQLLAAFEADDKGAEAWGEKFYEEHKEAVTRENDAFVHDGPNTLYFLTQKGDGADGYRTGVRRAFLGEPVPDWRELQTVDDGEYMVLDDEDADERAEEYIDSTIDDMLHGVPESVKNYFDRERFVADVIRNDGRGSTLSSYDGDELEREYNGTTYYIYRTN